MAPATKTICCYCGVGCGIQVRQGRSGSLFVEGDPDHPVNQGKLCSKGLNLHTTVMDRSDRLLFPEVRDTRNGLRRRVTWDEALDRVAREFREIIDKHGADAVGLYVSGQCLTEEYYLANKLTKGFLGTNNIDTNSRLCMSSAVAGYKLSLGEDCVPGCYEDLDLADLYLVAGANPAWCHPILFRRIEARLQEPKAARMIVIDPRRTQSAAVADLHIAPMPGTDITLHHAIARRLIELGAIDAGFIRDHCEGFEELRARVFERTLGEAASICQVEESTLHTAAAWIAEARGFVSMWAMGLNQSVVGVNKNLSLINLHLLTGKIGKPGNGPLSLTGQPNAMGGREVGGMANLLSAHRDMSNPAHREEIARFWGVPRVPHTPGLTAGEMMDALCDGRLKALWVICTNPMVSWPDLAKAERAFGAAQLVVVQDISERSDTLKFADVILPAAGWLEKEGTMTNSERRVSYLPRVLPPPGEALPDGEILIRFARKMGWGASFAYASVDEIYREHAALTKGTSLDVSGLDHGRLKLSGTFQWPVPTVDHPGTPRLFTDHRFYRPNQRARLHPVPDGNTSPPTSADLPLILTTGRVRDQWHTMTRSGKVAKLCTHEPRAKLTLHPRDAAARGISDGTLVRIRNATGQVAVRASLSEDIRPGVVFLPMHWGRIAENVDARANNLTAGRWDPISKEPDLKYTAVEVEPLRTPRRRIVIVGAGAAALAFVRAYRQDNREDNIIVFSKEAQPFYDRVRLPEVVAHPSSWEGLAMLGDDEARQLGIEVRHGLGIVAIDRQSKRIRDSEGVWHDYDTLVLAMGSRAAWPGGTPEHQQGLHALRSFSDAQDILRSASTGRSFVIVGGGLVGIELASALRSRGIEVHIIQRSSQLMNKQLDDVAAGILRDELVDRGIELHFLEQVVKWTGDDWIEELHLASGQIMRNVVLVYAMGTVPNAELAGACGLAVNQGIVVDEALRTSDPDVLALGEIAEFQGRLYGTTSAAEEQARIAAAALAGDGQSVYTGSVAQNILKVEGVRLASLGTARPPLADDSYEEIVFLDRAERIYKKCVVHEDRLVGALLVGDTSDFARLRDLIRGGETLGTRRAGLLSGKASSPSHGGGQTICSCLSVDEGALRQVCASGANTVAKLMQSTGAGTGCGSCRPELATLLAKSLLKPAA